MLGTLAHAGEAALSLPEVLSLARDNLEVKLATRGLAAAQGDLLAADHAPLPQLSAKLSQLDLQHGVGPGNWWSAKRIDKGVGVDWTWERGDKRLWRTEAARQAASAARWDLQEVRLQQSLAAQGAYFEVLAAQQRQEDLAAMARSASELSQAAARRVAAGDLSRQDADRAAIEADRARGDVDAALADLARARVVLAQLIGREGDALQLRAAGPWPLESSGLAEVSALAHTLDRALETVPQRADVQSATSRVESAQAALAGSRAQRQSDVTWGVSMDHVPGTSTRQMELRLQMPLQWGYRFEGEAVRAQAQLDQARDGLDRTQRAAQAEMTRLHAELVAALSRARRYVQDIVPRSRSVADKAELAYAKGALSLTDLLDARRTLRAALMEASTAHADAAKAQTAWQLRTAPL